MSSVGWYSGKSRKWERRRNKSRHVPLYIDRRLYERIMAWDREHR